MQPPYVDNVHVHKSSPFLLGIFPTENMLYFGLLVCYSGKKVQSIISNRGREWEQVENVQYF